MCAVHIFWPMLSSEQSFPRWRRMLRPVQRCHNGSSICLAHVLVIASSSWRDRQKGNQEQIFNAHVQKLFRTLSLGHGITAGVSLRRAAAKTPF